MDKLLGMIGLAQRGGFLAVGEEPVGAACRARDCRLILVARDAADNSFRRVRHFADAGQCLWVSLPCTRVELGQAVGRGVCAMAAVTDIGFADAVVKRLAQQDPERYGSAKETLSAKAEKAARRRKEQQIHEKKLRTQGRIAKPYIPTRIKRAGKPD